MDRFHRRRDTALNTVHGGTTYKRAALRRTAAPRTTLVWAALAASALALGGCSSLTSFDSMPTGSISAKSGGKLGATPVAYTSEPVPKGIAPDDWAAARAALSEALGEKVKAPSVPWENYASATRGTVTPLGAVEAEGRGTCREFLMSFVRNSNEEWLQGEACRAGRGAWKVDEARLLQRS